MPLAQTPEQQHVTSFLQDMETKRSNPDFEAELRRSVKNFTASELTDLMRRLSVDPDPRNPDDLANTVPTIFREPSGAMRRIVMDAASERRRELSKKITPLDRANDAMLNAPVIKQTVDLVAEQMGRRVETMTTTEKRVPGLIIAGIGLVAAVPVIEKIWKVITYPFRMIFGKGEKHEKGGDGGGGHHEKHGMMKGFLALFTMTGIAAGAAYAINKFGLAGVMAKISEWGNKAMDASRDAWGAAMEGIEVANANHDFATLKGELKDRKPGDPMPVFALNNLNQSIKDVSEDAKRDKMIAKWGLDGGKTIDVPGKGGLVNTLKYDPATKNVEVTERIPDVPFEFENQAEGLRAIYSTGSANLPDVLVLRDSLKDPQLLNATLQDYVNLHMEITAKGGDLTKVVDPLMVRYPAPSQQKALAALAFSVNEFVHKSFYDGIARPGGKATMDLSLKEALNISGLYIHTMEAHSRAFREKGRDKTKPDELKAGLEEEFSFDQSFQSGKLSPYVVADIESLHGGAIAGHANELLAYVRDHQALRILGVHAAGDLPAARGPNDVLVREALMEVITEMNDPSTKDQVKIMVNAVSPRALAGAPSVFDSAWSDLSLTDAIQLRLALKDARWNGNVITNAVGTRQSGKEILNLKLAHLFRDHPDIAELFISL